jgi:hypothetical protein
MYMHIYDLQHLFNVRNSVECAQYVLKSFKVVLGMLHNRGTSFVALWCEQMEAGKSQHVDNKGLGAWHLAFCVYILYS